MEIALIAHDGKKAEMVQFLNENIDVLHQKNVSLISTGATGERVESTGL